MRLFGTDGVRGIAGEELTLELAAKLSYTAASLICNKNKLVVIGRDTRESGKWLDEAIIEGLMAQGARVVDAGVIPTPGVSYLTRHLNADMGVVISASHNPSEYNGIKFFDSRGIKLSDDIEHQIESNLEGPAKLTSKGHIEKIDAQAIYVDHLKRAVKIPLNGMKISIDCANGAASFIGPQLFNDLGVDVRVHDCTPDGKNINHQCGSTYPQNLQADIKNEDVDAGFAFDGDTDRVIAVDEAGNLVDGDFIMAICAKYKKENNKLEKNSVVTTVMTNLGFHLAMRDLGIKVLVTDVGDKYVLDEMINSNVILGGEQSGHIIFLEHGTAGDGLLSALKLLQIVKQSDAPLSELTKVMKRLPQVLINVKVKDKSKLDDNKRAQEAIKQAEKEFGDSGRVLVRPSGTEQLIRVMTEAERETQAQEAASSLADVVKEEFS